MKVYGGIDLHSDNSVLGLIDEEDRVVYRKRLPNDLETILVELAPLQEEICSNLVYEPGLMEGWKAAHRC